jgi:hypothetical protein
MPVRDSVAWELDALLAKEREPDAVPWLFGVKAMFNDILWPAAMVNGKEAPFSTNIELLLAAEEMVTFAPVAPTLIC